MEHSPALIIDVMFYTTSSISVKDNDKKTVRNGCDRVQIDTDTQINRQIDR